MIVDVTKLLIRYNGIGKELSGDEREIILFALLNESEARGGIAADAKQEYEKELRRKRIASSQHLTSPICPTCGGSGEVWSRKYDGLRATCPGCAGGNK